MKLNNLKLIINNLPLLLLLTSALFFFPSCDTTNPPSNQKITLEAEDASCTEAWLNLKLENIALPATVDIKLSFDKLNNLDSTIITANINSADTTLFIENLLPNQTYKLKAYLTKERLLSEAEITTMDTTSHNFTWETFEIGNRGILRDVAIINENNIWAVGEIYVNDSLGQSEPTARGFAQWNGEEWIISRKEAIGPTGVKSNLRPYGIIAFAENDIWFAHGGVFHWDGEEVKPYWINKFPGNPSPILEDGQLISKLWGTSSSNLYAIGNNGALAHFDGNTWTSIESNTEVDLLDIWGAEDGNVVWACGYDSDYSRTVLLRIENGDVKLVYEGSPNNQNNGYYVNLLRGIYSKGNNRIYLMNGSRILTQPNSEDFQITGIVKLNDFGYSIGGNDLNDIFISGQHGLVGHYNGYSYIEYEELKSNTRFLYSLDARDNLTAIVGEEYLGIGKDKGLIIIGKQ